MVDITTAGVFAMVPEAARLQNCTISSDQRQRVPKKLFRPFVLQPLDNRLRYGDLAE
jgi:hypothetical protein